MNEILKAMTERRSTRSYRSEMIPKAILDSIIQAGLYAASGRNFQSPVIIAVTDKTVRDRLSEMNRKIGGWQEGFDPFYNAPAVLVVLADKTKPTYVYDGSLVMVNLMLAAHAMELGNCWIHRAKEEFDSDEGKELLRSLGIEGDYEGIGHCIIGYPAGELSSAPPRHENRIFFV